MAVHQTVSLAQTEIAQTVASDILRTETSLGVNLQSLHVSLREEIKFNRLQ